MLVFVSALPYWIRKKNNSNGAQNEYQKLNMKILGSRVAIIKRLVRAHGEGVTVFIGQH
jgi:hypothetical protein